MGRGGAGRTGLEKTLISISVLLFLTLVILLVVHLVGRGSSSDGAPTGNSPICWSKECIETAGKVLSTMDESVDPCSDFYEFACGRYSKTRGLSESEAERATDTVRLAIKDLLESSSEDGDMYLESARNLYQTCMKFDGLRDEAELRDLMQRLRVGTWPLVDPFFDVDSRLSLAHRLSALALLGVHVAFRLDVAPDPRSPSALLLKISAGGPRERGRSRASIVGDAGLRARTFHAFLLLGAKETHARTDTPDVLAADAHYAFIRQDEEVPCGPIDILSPEESLKELHRLVPEMNWTALISMVRTEAGISEPFGVELHCRAKIRDYINYLEDMPLRVSYNYLGWRFFSVFERHLRPDSVDAGGDLTNAGRWRECVKLVESHAPTLLSPALAPPPIAQMKAANMADQIKVTTEKLLNQSSWLNQQQKRKIEKQVQKFSVFPYLEEKSNDSIALEKLPPVQLKNYTYVVIELQKQWVIRRLKALNMTSTEKTHQLSDIYSSNAMLPSASLAQHFAEVQEPYLRLHATDWMNFGGFGVSAARRVFLFFLSQKVGKTRSDRTSAWDMWWSNREASGCFLNLFSEQLGLNLEVHDEQIVEELFLDSKSLELSYVSAVTVAADGKALPGLQELSMHQLFFLSHAQTFCVADEKNRSLTHIPIHKRINTAVYNSKYFREAFQCSTGKAVC